MGRIRDIVNPRALPPSGRLSMSQIKGEFNKGNTFSLYYAAAGGIPASGRMSMSDFYGKSDAPPPGVDQILWEGGSVNPTTKNLIPSVRVLQAAQVPSGTPPNIASTTASAGVGVSNASIDAGLTVNASNAADRTRMCNPKAEISWNVKDWDVPDTALGCKIKFTVTASSRAADIAQGTPRHYLYGAPSFGAAKTEIWEGSGPSYSIPSFYAYSFTSTQTIHEYKSNNQALIMEVHWTTGDGSNYNRWDGGSGFGSTLKVTKIECIA